jgi:hypothetical protein
VVVHNARYTGAGHMDTFLDAPIGAIQHQLQGNFSARNRRSIRPSFPP